MKKWLLIFFIIIFFLMAAILLKSLFEEGITPIRGTFVYIDEAVGSVPVLYLAVDDHFMTYSLYTPTVDGKYVHGPLVRLNDGIYKLIVEGLEPTTKLLFYFESEKVHLVNDDMSVLIMHRVADIPSYIRFVN